MNFKKNILAIDTSLHSCSISLLYKKKIYSLFKLCSNAHEKNIFYMIKKILIQSNTTLDEINFIACTIGPGSFTGIRISIGISQTISTIYNIPIIGFSTLKILSEQSWRKNYVKNVLLIIKISKNQIFWAKYIKNKIGLWIGEHTEKLFSNMNIIKKKIKKYTGKWSLIGFEKKIKKNFKKSVKLFQTNIFTPHSNDIITYAVKYLLLYKKYNIKQIYPKYLYKI
ncbi:tRNA (adenosine(37)-N6)-threonylcarbamoyltransferase complex dimerization subunit type 1 TsaB [Buchnera aphidicola]|uniref:tRNA threonylcarbamoyladenosine biosynthesis protein TsaB n=1 Tax=Buchnera aphidicola subsp. Cinara cedri (strain Cc) TaxID=372461 RepID=Q057M5_BUCCC|nr:tRNA (adenosine(37)-N6)-threonylcarbamoyltransferase complex dimerization subunit type 1 TsaB [Buchnera aphidicola]ABJ90674.1 putative glycoprotein endopeptidase, M22 peptidase [Buchnera aphidicola BCc]